MSNINEKLSKDNNQSEILKYKEQEKANEDDMTFDAFESKILNSDAINNSDKKSSLTTENQGWIHDSVNEEPEKEESTEKIRIKNRRMILGLVYGCMFIICLITVILIKMKYDYDHEILQEQVQNGKDLLAISDIDTGQINEVSGYEDGFYTKDVYGADGKFIFREKYRYITAKADAEKTDINDESGNNDEGIYDSIIDTVFDSQGRRSKEIYASGSVSEYFYEEGFPSYTKIESKYSDGANSVEKTDGYYHTLSWDRYEKNGEHLNAQNDWNGNRVLTYYGSDGKISDIEYEYAWCREDWIFSGYGKPIGLYFWFDEQSDWVEVYLSGDGYVTTETQSDGTIVKKLIDSELTYILTEKPNGNIKKEIIDKKGLCRYTIETWNRENMVLITKYDKEGYIDEWAVSIRKFVFKHDTVPLEHTKGYVGYNEDDNCLEYVLYDASIDETEKEDKIIKKYFTFGRTETIRMVDGNIVMDDVDVSECFNYTDNYREMFPGNEEYDIEKIFSFYED